MGRGLVAILRMAHDFTTTRPPSAAPLCDPGPGRGGGSACWLFRKCVYLTVASRKAAPQEASATFLP